MERYVQTHGTKSSRSLKPALWGGVAVVALLLAGFVLTPLFNTLVFFGGSSDLSLQEERIESFGRFNIGEQRAVSSEAQPFRAAEPPPVQPTPQAVPQETTAAPAPVQAQTLKLNFALVPADVVAKWIQLSSDFLSNDSVSSGVLGPVTLQDSARDVEPLMSFNSEDLEEGLTFLTTLEELPTIESLGFSLEGEWEQGILTLEAVQVVPVRQQEGASPTWNEKESVQRWTFDLKNGSSAFIVGLMPRPVPLRRTTPWNLPGLFDLWDSEDFVVGQKELVLIIAPGR